MNERISALFCRAGGSVTVTENSVLTYTEHFDPEKFAELIVRECYDIVEQHEPLNTWTKRYSTLIKEHFGIEK